MDSEFQQQQYQHHFQDFPRQQYQPQQTSGLTRFRSAPSSYFASFLDVAADTVAATGGASGGGGGGGGRGDFGNARPLSPETENIFARFMSNIGAEMNSSSQKPSNLAVNPPVQPQFTVRIKQETDTQQEQNQEQQQQRQQQPMQQQQPIQQQQPMQQQQQIQQGNYSDPTQMFYQSPSSKAPMSNHQNSAMKNSFGGAAAGSMGNASTIAQMKTGFGGRNINNNNSSLTRHSSSPAGFFDNLDIDVGYGIMSGMGNYGDGMGGNVQVNISSGQSNNSELMNRNSDGRAKRVRMDSLDERRFSHSSSYDFPMNSWDDSILSENFSGLEGVQEEDRKIFPELNATENQSGEGKNRPPSLTHHLSLTKTRPELSNMEKFLQFQDSVPLRIRAKRGCATHPRSIAERVRRTRISERMRKLQDLVPNMDKQTNTADMLDLAVDYIKDLQKQLEILADNRAKCTCSR